MSKVSLLTMLGLTFAGPAAAAQKAPPVLKASSCGRFLVEKNGDFFFYLGDTAWELFHRLTLEESELYLKDRAGKGFTVIQGVILAEFDGLNAPNAYGHTPLADNDPARPNEEYFRHVDKVVKAANKLGLTMGLLPTWGDKVGPKKWGRGPEVFTEANARAYGEFLGRRYRKCGVIWILGGDRVPETEEQKRIWRAMAAGIRAGDKGRHLMTYHPWGGTSSGDFFHAEEWLSFNMFQSGHGSRETDNAVMIDKDYALSPAKPCLDGEPAYEDHPINWKPENGWFDDADVRRQAYRSLFSGAFGHTYGCNDIWQFFGRGREPVGHARTPWKTALALPGAAQMRFARALIESRPPLLRIPDNAVLAQDPGNGPARPRACRASDGSYAFVYLPEGGEISVRLDSIKDGKAFVWWYDPRLGGATPAGEFPALGRCTLTAPASGRGNDWIMVLDAVSRNFPPPGRPLD